MKVFVLATTVLVSSIALTKVGLAQTSSSDLQIVQSKVELPIKLAGIPLSKEIVLAIRLPVGVSYVAGTGVSDQTASEPTEVNGWLFWKLKDPLKDTNLSFSVTHIGSLAPIKSRLIYVDYNGRANLVDFKSDSLEDQEILLAVESVKSTEETPPAKPEPLAIGNLGLQLGYFDNKFSIEANLRAFAQGPFSDENDSLALATDFGATYVFGEGFKTFGSLKREPVSERFPVLGDASQMGTEAFSNDSFYFRYERGANFLSYGRLNPNFSGVISNYSPDYNGLSGQLMNDQFRANAFAALVAVATQKQTFRGDGTSLYQVQFAPVDPLTDRLSVVVRSKLNPNLEISRRQLTRYVDYTIDSVSGVILLRAPLLADDVDGNPQFLEAEYAAVVDKAPLEFRGGLQTALQFALNDQVELEVKATALRHSNKSPLFAGLGLGLTAPGIKGEIEAGWSNQFAWGASVSADIAPVQANVRYREAMEGYDSPNGGSAGRDIDASVKVSLLQNMGALNNLFAESRLKFNQAFNNGPTNPVGELSAGLGAKFLSNSFSSWRATAGYLNRFNPDLHHFAVLGLGYDFYDNSVDLIQRVPIPFAGSSQFETEIKTSYAISQNFSVALGSKFLYGNNESFKQQGYFGLVGQIGGTTLAATYDMPDGGDNSSDRLGVEATMPIGHGLNLAVGGETRIDGSKPFEGSVSSALAYSADNLRASGRAQFSFVPNGVKQVYTAGAILRLTDNLIVSPTAEFTTGPDGSGTRFSVAAAYRGLGFSLLTNNIFRQGIYAPNGQEIRGEVLTSYQINNRFSIRGGFAYLSSAVFTGEVSAGVTYFFSDIIGAGLNGSAMFQPATGTAKFSVGAEASLRVIQDVLLSAGVNFIGYSGLGSFSTAPGFYLRLDIKFDERWFGFDKK